MSRIDTARIIAGVADEQSGRYGTANLLPHEPSSPYRGAPAVVANACLKETVAVPIFTSSPQPTVGLASLIDILPKSVHPASLAGKTYEVKGSA